MTSTAILIPARYGSSRFSGKPLTDLGGISMIKRVVTESKKSGYPVYVLTDDQRVANEVNNNTTVVIDNYGYENGTERCSGAAGLDFLRKYDQFINVQGDMPDVNTDMIDAAVWGLEESEVSTVYTDMSEQEQNNPNSVKLIRCGTNALWFGRGITGYGDWHLGVYGYKRSALSNYINFSSSKEEQVERLEQIRWLMNNIRISCVKVKWDGIEINTPEDAVIWNQKK